MIIAYPLGQVGYLYDVGGLRIVIDPYLTDSVAEQFGESLRRLAQPTLSADEMTDVAWVLITHAHLDHADPSSLVRIARSSPRAQFLAPAECVPILVSAEIEVSKIRVVTARERFDLSQDCVVTVIPAAHTHLEVDSLGRSRYVGYHLLTPFGSIYHAGDTVPHEEIFCALKSLPVDHAFLPVNERNYFREAAGIVGNMSAREAFAFAERIHARSLIPTHWDLFAANSTHPWEVESLYTAIRPPFALRFMPCGASYRLEKTA
jgi:L-ascorbate metabolism protein UlaG (beta-lactamase superfamily)